MTEPLLEVRSIEKHFGGIVALDDCSLTVAPQAMVGVIGPNGSGKSTLFATITGMLRPDRGTIVFDGRRIDGMATDRIARLGIGRTFQLSRVFRGMTVRQNLLAIGVPDGSPQGAAQRADELLEIVGIAHQAEELAGSLSYGQQRLLEFARLFMLTPKLVLMDELFAGVNPTLQNHLASFVEDFHRRYGTSFVIIDHNMRIIARLCPDVVVMHQGRVIARAPLADIQQNEEVIAAYLGKRTAAPTVMSDE